MITVNGAVTLYEPMGQQTENFDLLLLFDVSNDSKTKRDLNKLKPFKIFKLIVRLVLGNGFSCLAE